MIESPEEYLIKLAEKKISTANYWGIMYWTLYNWLSIFSWFSAISVPFGLSIMYIAKPENFNSWNIIVLVFSGFGLVCQILSQVLKLKERAYDHRKMESHLSHALLKFNAKTISKEKFIEEMGKFLNQAWQEKGP